MIEKKIVNNNNYYIINLSRIGNIEIMNDYPSSIELAGAKIFVFLSIVHNGRLLTEPKIVSGCTAIVRN